MLKQTFITSKGTKIEIIGTRSTGRKLDQVLHEIRANGVLQKTKYNQTQIKQLMVE